VKQSFPSITSPLRSYLRVLGLPGVVTPVLGVVVASVPIGALSLAMLLLVEARTGRYSLAGFVIGALACGTGIGIFFQGRLMDRFGQPAVLVIAVLVQLPTLCVFALALPASTPPWVLAVLAFTAGSCEPQVGGGLRALWPDLVPERLRDTALAWSSLIFEVSLLLGPLLLTVVLAVANPAVAVTCCGVFFATGACILASSGAARAWRAGPRDRVNWLGALASRGVRLLAALAAVVGAVAGFLQFSAATLTDSYGMPQRAPWIYAALSAGSLIGVVGYGARRWRGPIRHRLAVMLCCLGAAALSCAVASGPTVLGIAMFSCGLMLGPLTMALFSIAAEHIPAGTEAGGFTTLTAASLAANAAASAAAGFLAGHLSPAAGVLIAGALAGISAPLIFKVRSLR
jgi:MFS family permease